jgi:hypothetical protein
MVFKDFFEKKNLLCQKGDKIRQFYGTHKVHKYGTKFLTKLIVMKFLPMKFVVTEFVSMRWVALKFFITNSVFTIFVIARFLVDKFVFRKFVTTKFLIMYRYPLAYNHYGLDKKNLIQVSDLSIIVPAD